MQIKTLEIEKIVPYHNNPRKNQAIDKVASSIKEFGFQQPIVIDKDNIIIVGHTRLEASKKLGLKEVPVVVAELSETKAKAYRLADNRVNQDSEWDITLLNLELDILKEDNFDLKLTGFNQEEIDNILDNQKTNDFNDLSNEQEDYFKSISFMFDDLETYQDLLNKIEKYKENNNLDTKEQVLIDLLK